MNDRIGEKAQDRLLASSSLAIRSIGCSCHDGVLTLRGCLASQHQKQLALAIVADLEGVREIVNQIRVGPADARAPGGGRPGFSDRRDEPRGQGPSQRGA